MILLFSRQDDGSTRQVAEWLYAMDKKFIRFNADDQKISFSAFDLQRCKFSVIINNRLYKFSVKSVKSVWHRRSGFSKDNFFNAANSLSNLFHELSSFAEKHLKEETTEMLDYLYHLLEKNSHIHNIGSQLYNAVNKLIVLDLANSCGLQTPQSFIISTKKDLASLLKKEKKLITKAIGNGVYRFTNEFGYYSYTEKIDKSFINSLPDIFFPSIVQKQIDKQYELRIFCLEGKFYAMAIFSQETLATAIDSRKNFGSDWMPRRVPYLLPEEIKSQLKELMMKLKLNTGSIDMIVTRRNEYYFLEVNPIGQFGMVSQPCNYYLEKKIAESL
ncbi:MAG: grasp-with-spasm system ATP-grasp peptide maturase [Ginsengibacter sp.]